MLRLFLTVAAFFVGSFGSFFVLMLITWDQGVIDVVTTFVGLVAAAGILFATRPSRQGVHNL
jgi:hypothetical protein